MWYWQWVNSISFPFFSDTHLVDHPVCWHDVYWLKRELSETKFSWGGMVDMVDGAVVRTAFEYFMMDLHWFPFKVSTFWMSYVYCAFCIFCSWGKPQKSKSIVLAKFIFWTGLYMFVNCSSTFSRSYTKITTQGCAIFQVLCGVARLILSKVLK